MALDAWLPVGYELAHGERFRRALFEGPQWQIVETQNHERALLATDELIQRWLDSGLISEDDPGVIVFGSRRFGVISCGHGSSLGPVAAGTSPSDKTEAMAFALSLKASRDIDPDCSLHDAIYAEDLQRLLPTYGPAAAVSDDHVLGAWLTGGARISALAFTRLSQTLSWLGPVNLREVLLAAGFAASERDRPENTYSKQSAPFELPGRSELTAFINEHIIDIVQNRERYEALGIGFPSAVVLHGPPGCGKTFAVERLVDYLGWPSFQIDASSVASPYIHETSKKVAEIFNKAMENAPSVLVIDEMEAFLADREMGNGQHHVEEVAEFLRRIPEATKHNVLIVAMTNRVEMIDSAILRRGRFDHIIKVDYATEAEVLSLLNKLLSALPQQDDVDAEPLAEELLGRPLSDVAFVVREGARLAARAGKDRIDQDSLLAALKSAPVRVRDGGASRPIGFI